MIRVRITTTLLVFLLFAFSLSGQETPINPISFRVFNPFILNPAIAGSKDYLSIEAIASFQGKNKSQILSANSRLAKSTQAYVSSPESKDFTNVGIGGFMFNDVSDTSTSIGLSAAGSYHFPLNNSKTSFLSVGASVKGVYNKIPAVATDPESSQKKTFFPNADAGIYFYSPKFYAGLSAVNILGNPDTLDISDIPVTREYFLMTGYKFVISSTRNIVIEPSIIFNTDDSLSMEFEDFVNPVLKLYFERFCVGTYVRDYDDFAFFFQYNYPGLYIGAYFEYPRATAFYKKELVAEVTLGINISGKKLRTKETLHW